MGGGGVPTPVEQLEDKGDGGGAEPQGTCQVRGGPGGHGRSPAQATVADIYRTRRPVVMVWWWGKGGGGRRWLLARIAV